MVVVISWGRRPNSVSDQLQLDRRRARTLCFFGRPTERYWMPLSTPLDRLRPRALNARSDRSNLDGQHGQRRRRETDHGILFGLHLPRQTDRETVQTHPAHMSMMRTTTVWEPRLS